MRIFPLIIGSCLIWSVMSFSDFVKKLGKEKEKEYNALFASRQNLTRKEFYDLCERWAVKQGAEAKRAYRRYRREEEKYLRQRDQVLRERLIKKQGSATAKKFLLDLLDLQRDMNLKLYKYEQREEALRNSIPKAILKEATKLWNKLDPAYIY